MTFLLFCGVQWNNFCGIQWNNFCGIQWNEFNRILWNEFNRVQWNEFNRIHSMFTGKQVFAFELPDEAKGPNLSFERAFFAVRILHDQ